MQNQKENQESKLHFKSIKAQNFRSVQDLALNLDENNKTLICSEENGDGKSTMIVYALYFALFDKNYRGSKPSLVNSAIGKNCLVQVEFSTQGKEYIVRRGIKPNVFEIIQNGELLPQTANNYQQVLLEIIGFDEKAFLNQVVLGKDKFVPFTDMSRSERRAHGEQMMNWAVFNRMDKIAKDRLKVKETEKRNQEFEINLNDNTIQNTKKSISLLEEVIENLNKGNQDKIKVLQQEVLKLNSDTSKLQELLSNESHETEKYQNLRSSLEAKKSQEVSKLSSLKSKIQHYQNLEDCPTCTQNVPSSLKDSVLEVPRKEYQESEETLQKIEQGLLKVQELYQSESKKKERIDKIRERIQIADTQIKSKNSQIQELQNTNTSEYTHKLNQETQELTNLKKKDLELKSELEKRTLEFLEYSEAVEMLKDDGIKTVMIQDYLPVINSRLNYYLNKLNLFITVEMDSSFNLGMHAPDRKGQTLESLSSGQLNRINLALLFVWRDIAKTLSTIDTNILVLDEVLESLSEQGVQDFIEFYDSEFQMNLFVVSQRSSEFSVFFDDVIMYKLENGFTEIIEN